MKIKKTNIEAIKLEDLLEYDFDKKDVLLTSNDKIRREWSLMKAKDFGNSFMQSKSRLIIKTKSGYKKLTARVVTFTKKKVVLSGQNQIPTSSILDVKVLSV